MAQQKRKSSSNSTGKKKTSNSTARRTNTASRKQAEPQKSGFAAFFDAFRKTKIFKPVVIIIAIILVILIDLLISWNTYQKFFMFLGIEILLVAFFFAVRIASNINKEQNEEEN